jgi:hypothetical protein
MNYLIEMSFFKKFWLGYFVIGMFLVLVFEIIISILKLIKKTRNKACATFPFGVPIGKRISIMFFYLYMAKIMFKDIRDIIKN